MVETIEHNGEKIHLKKGFGGYRVVNPVLREGTEPWHKRIIWINFLVGGWQNLFTLLFLLLIIGGNIFFTTQQLERDNNFIELVFERVEEKCPLFFESTFRGINQTSIEDFKKSFLLNVTPVT